MSKLPFKTKHKKSNRAQDIQNNLGDITGEPQIISSGRDTVAIVGENNSITIDQTARRSNLWEKWKLGILPISISFLIGGTYLIFHFNYLYFPRESQIENRRTEDEIIQYRQQQNLSDYSYLDQDQIRQEITKAKKTGNINKAITLLKYLKDNNAKEEEGKRVISFLITNNELELADALVNQYLKNPIKKEYLKKINREKSKN